ncbi:MAG: hypothetical protein EOP11_11050 [Proteobacteria bacterium]|nr:MAG: hypothetical protein EOP11_11050 [Pseudomonadota bacterium]
MVFGILISFFLWILAAGVAYFAVAFVAREKILNPKWQLLVSFVVAAAFYYLIRYRLAFLLGDAFEVRMFFGASSFVQSERLAAVIVALLFYAVTVLKPTWAQHPWIRLALLFIIPFAIKFLLVYTGITPWEGLGDQEVPLRVI